MIPTLHTDWTVGDLCQGFVYNEYEGKGLFGLDGKLTIQPEYQRHYIYNDGKLSTPCSKVIHSDLSTSIRPLRGSLRYWTDNSASHLSDAS